MTARYKVWVCGRSLAGIAGSNAAGGHGCLYCVCCIRTVVWNISDINKEERI